MTETSQLPVEASEVLQFWFDELKPEQWWKRDDDVNATITERFGGLYAAHLKETPSDWLKQPRGSLAAVIVLDQFPRNMFRDYAHTYATDKRALELLSNTISAGWDMELEPGERMFLYMPYQHSEDREMQARSVELFMALGNEDNLDFAIKHKEIVDRFGRFPHRNEMLGRKSTPEEIEFLKEPGLFW